MKKHRRSLVNRVLLVTWFAVINNAATISVHASPVASPELSNLFLESVDTWKISTGTFMRLEAHNGFAWDSLHEQTSASSDSPTLRFVKIPILQADAHFDDGVLDKLTFSFYNRGDVGWLIEDEFRELISSCREKINDWVGHAPSSKVKKRQTNKIQKYSVSWRKGSTLVRLEWSGTKKRRVDGVVQPYRAEYLRLTLSPAGKKSNKTSRAENSATQSRHVAFSDIKSKVRRDKYGDVFLPDIPMVNQRDKNYCAVATAARVMGYYNRDIDQHELAQMVDTNFLGTYPELMIKALKKLAFKLGVKIRVHEKFEDKEFFKMIAKYNKTEIVRHHKVPKITHGQYVDVFRVYSEMHYDTLKNIKTERRADKTRFLRKVTRRIDKGVPVIWSVVIGIAPESPTVSSSVGGHTRLIIGYNENADQIIYTDSWGSGHEFKRMSVEDAMTITFGLFTIEPRSRK